MSIYLQHNDGLSDSEVVGIAVSVPLVGIVTSKKQ